MITKPVSQLSPIDLASGEIDHHALLLIDWGVDLGAVEDEEGLHGGVADAFVAIHERVVLNQREAQCRGLLDQGGVQSDITERGLGLSDGRVERAKIADASPTTSCVQEAAVQIDHLAERQIPHQARRRYNSSFLRSTRSAAVLKSSLDVARRSVTAARASSSDAMPRRAASSRRRAACASERSMMSFTGALYRGAESSNNPLQRTGGAGR